ncbi:nucleoside diphosphate-linked moiety X motif 17 isoform X2 [Antennarius striatus]|uniref:nucleoside diphosphate-linked moiety X motif 17 isoform X2 n=1 Tax=Antennarius striatus TaxID=241820 RepID=UPI0035AFD003
METVRRVLVYVSKDGAAPARAQFVQSLVGHFGDSGADEVEVCWSLKRNQVILSGGREGRGTLLKRPALCPMKHLSATEAAAIPLDVQQRGVDVGVAILLQTSNQRVLLTRRTKELRIFPNIWVAPGGHVEPQETLLDAGLRELREETGLELGPEETSPKILGLWESVYPPMLSRGLPQRHHLVIFMLLRSSRSHLQLQASLAPCPAEVSACLWADRRLSGAIASAVDGEPLPVGPDDLLSSVSVSLVSPGGGLSDTSLPVSVFVSRVPVTVPDVEQVSSGTRFALKQWLKRPVTSDPSGSASSVLF